MKRFLSFLVALLLSLFSMSAIAPAHDDGDDGDEINVEKQENNSNDPTSISTCNVRAYLNPPYLTVNILNYTGYADAAVSGINGSIIVQNVFISGAGTIVLDISTLQPGNYSLTISADALYIGDFVKN